MSTKHDSSAEAQALRHAAIIYSSTLKAKGLAPAEWRVLTRAAVAYAKLLLAGQCIPFPKAIVKEPKSK